MEIRIDDLRGPEIKALLESHLDLMRSLSPPESVHALDLDRLRVPELTFWTIWEGENLIGCGALKELCEDQGEIKSMHTAQAHRGKGAAQTMLSHVLDTARTRGYKTLNLETGSQPGFAPARALYIRNGFKQCGPFGSYKADPNSAFFTLDLEP